jgi:hypothetical protein
MVAFFSWPLGFAAAEDDAARDRSFSGSTPHHAFSPPQCTIHAQRKLDIQASSSVLATTPLNLKTSLSLHTAPPLIDFPRRLKASSHTAIMAEIKRASPSNNCPLNHFGSVRTLITLAPAKAYFNA